MEGRDKKIVIGVGISLVFSVVYYFYNAARERDLVANAKYKAVAGGLEESMKKMAESAKPKAPEPPKLPEPPKANRAVAAVMPVTPPPVFKDEVHLDPIAPPNPEAQQMTYTPPPAPMPYVPPSAMDLKLAEIAQSDSSMYLRYKGYLFRVSLKKGIKLGAPQLTGFSGQKVETIVSDDAAAPCNSNCYQLSEKLVGQLKDKKTARAFLKTQGWFLVSDQDSEHCDAPSSKKLTVTQDIEGKCLLGMVSEGRTVKMTDNDARAHREASSIMIMQRIAAREPASTN